MEKITIKSGNNEYTYYPAINNSGNFECSTLEESIFTKGSSCSVFLAINDKNERFLIKQYNKGFTIDQEIDRISIDIKNRYNKQSSNYIMKELYSGVDNFGKACKVFEYKNGNVLKPYKETKSIFAEENKEKLFDILLIFASFLHSLKLLHTEIDGAEYYLHNDIKPENVFSLRVNNDRIAQLIDLDSVCSGQFLIDKIESGEFSGDFNFIIPTTSKYYTREDINSLCDLKGDELRRCIRVLDTTAAAKMLCMVLFGRYDHSIPERDVNDYDSNEALQIAINSFLQKGISNNFTERFATVDEMIEEFSAILSKEQENLPQTIRTVKLLAMSDNRYINYRRNFYRKKNKCSEDYLVYIDDLCDEIDEGILPYVQRDSEEKICFADLLNDSRDNYILTAEGGGGKTTLFFYAFLKNIRDISDDELYIYIPLSGYDSDKYSSINDFIFRESEFSFKKLSKNNSNKITLLLDAFDEINIIRNGNENKKKTFTERFFNDIQGLKNVRVIISSRMLTGEESKSNFKTAKFLPLEEEQVKSFLNLDEAYYEELCQNNLLQTLLKNPFMLNIYKEVKDNAQEKIQINSAADLLDQYFWQMYKSKQKDSEYLVSEMKPKFNRLMDFVAESAFFEKTLGSDNLYLDKTKDIESKIEQLECYSNIIDLYQDDNNWHIRFSHMLFKEYFIARYLFSKLKCDTHNAKSANMEVLKEDFSYQTLIFVAQMFASPNIGDQEFDAKKYFEDLFEFVVDTVVDYEYIARNLLRIITFFMNGDLNEFDFKEYFSKHEFLEFAFNNCSELEHIIFPKDLWSIGYRAFGGCSSLTSITIPKGVTSIGYLAFGGCSSLTSITISKGVISIGDWAFSHCNSLTSITIPKGVISIGDWAFWGCNSLTSIMIPDSVTSIEMSAFAVCSSLMSINVDENNSAYKSIDGNVYSKDEKILIQYAIGKKDTSFAIPKGVTSIGDRAFRDCSSLTSITIPEGVTSIGDRAFRDCSSLTSITIPQGVTSIGGWTFWGCNSLTSIMIPDSVTSIGDWAFSGCSSLTSITIPKGVTSIGDWAFRGGNRLTSITIPKGVTQIGNYAFWGCSSLTDVFYRGTMKDFVGIYIYAGNEDFESATKYFYSEEAPTEEGNYWHYVDGVETIW